MPKNEAARVTTRSNEIKELFAEMLEAAEARECASNDQSQVQPLQAARAAFDAAAPEVRAAVERLLAAHGRASGVLLEETNRTRPAFGEPELHAAASDRDVSAAVKVLPPVIAGYEVNEEIGRGGFGVVYRARQHHPVERMVAVKVLRADLATAEVVSRFRAEARVLARMNHPGIARVLDAGLDHQHRPFVTTELVDGLPIVAYCDQHQLSVRQRVMLMTQVCDAVHHAHQRAVIHRDLKPANVLVERIDDRHRSRVIDFGIAKILEEGADDARTQVGARLGTPRYMSPEQVEGVDLGDVRTDVYALGVLLCEVLTTQVPRAPSGSDTSLRSTNAQRPSQLAAASEAAIAQRSREIRGDLDRIVLKAVAIEADERYDSAAALAEDLQRYLNGMPVRATPPGVVYLTRKFIARRKVASAAIVLASLSLITGTAAATYGLNRANRSRADAQDALIEAQNERVRTAEEAERAAFVTEFFLDDMLTAIDPDAAAGRDVTVAELLDVAARTAQDRFADAPELRRDVLGQIGAAYSRISRRPEAVAVFEEAVQTSEIVDGPVSAATLSLRVSLAEALFNTTDGHQRAAELRTLNAAEAVAALGKTHPVALRARLAVVSQIPDAVKIENELLDILNAMEAAEVEDSGSISRILQMLGTCRRAAGDQDAWLDYMARSVKITQDRFDPRHTRAIAARFQYGMALAESGRLDEAEPIVEEALAVASEIFPPEHSTLTSMRTTAVRIPMAREDFDEAAAIFEDLAAITAARDGEDSVAHINMLSNLALIQLEKGNPEAARDMLERIVPLRRQQWGATHGRTGITLKVLAEAYLQLEDYANALAIADEAAACTPTPGSSKPTRDVAALRAKALAGLGQHQEAVIALDQAIAEMEKVGKTEAAAELRTLQEQIASQSQSAED